MSTLKQHTLAKSGATDRPLILEKGNYMPWESRFRRILENNREDEEWMWLMYGSKKNKSVIHSRLMNEFENFEAKKGESLDFVYERLSTLVNVMNRNDVHPIKEKKAAKNHDPLALIAHSSQSHASPSYSHSPHPYYVTHPSSLIDSKKDYQRELQGDAHEDKLTIAMMLLARAITQKISTPTNNHLRTSLNTRNQAVINDGRVDIQTKNVGYGGNGNKNAWRQNRNQPANVGNAEGILLDEENNFMLVNAYGDETLEELIAVAVSEVNASHINLISSMISKGVHEHTNHEKLKTIINTSDDDQIDYNIIFDDPYVENNERRIRADKDTTEIILKEKDKTERDFFKSENEKVIIQHETQLAKKSFKARENNYLEDIVDLNDKLSSHDQIVYKLGQSIQTIHMFGKRPEKVYDPFLKARLEYQNPKRLKKAIAAQPEMYDCERLHSTKLIIDSPDSKETLEYAEESRLKMKNKMI
nr:hypothetical protein [Tanacetum cinerariifolium]